MQHIWHFFFDDNDDVHSVIMLLLSTEIIHNIQDGDGGSSTLNRGCPFYNNFYDMNIDRV